MKSANRPILQNAEGFSLVEVIASILLLTIILLSFFTMFVQTNKSKQTSNNIVDATYLAQREMENIYILSKSKGNASSQDIINLGYTMDAPQTLTFTKINNEITYKLTLKSISSSSNLTGVAINIKENNVSRAEMETIFKWQVTP